MFKKIIIVMLFVLCSWSVSAKTIEIKKPETASYVIKHVDKQPYFGVARLKDYNFEKSKHYLLNTHQTEALCSSFRKDQFHARNMDYYIRDYGLIALYLDGNNERIPSLNLVSIQKDVTKETIKSGIIPEQFRDILPALAVDGINQYGLVVNANIVVKDKRFKGYPTVYGKIDLPLLMIPRIILDKAKSVQEAIQLLQQYNIIGINKGELAKDDNHFMISDAKETAIVEFIDGEIKVTYFNQNGKWRTTNNNPCIMTNFLFNVYDQKVPFDKRYDELTLNQFGKAHPYAVGFERFLTLAEDFNQITNSEQAKNAIQKVFYTTYYTPTNLWYSENSGDYSDQKDTLKSFGFQNFDVTFNTRKGLLNKTIINQVRNEFESIEKRKKELNEGKSSDFWYTNFTILYDLLKKRNEPICSRRMVCSRLVQF